MKKIVIVILFFVLFICAKNVQADEIDDEFENYDFTGIDEIINEENDFDFGKCVKQIVRGQFENGINGLVKMVITSITSELQKEKTVIIKLIIIGLVSALFSNVTGGILSGKISETGFYITYMALVVTIMAGYGVFKILVTDTLGRLANLMQAITPVYILSIGFSAGESSAAAFYQVITIVITIIEKFLLNFVLPLIYIYLIINIINNLADGKMFTKALELLKTIIEWTLKTLLTFVVGLNMIRSLISPIVDSLKTGTLWKVMQSIPGVSGTLNPISQVVLASGTLIKNGIGITAMIAILVVCFVPVLKIAIITISYKAVSAILEPVTDKRVVNCINGVHLSMSLMLKTILYGTLFFVLTIAIICASTNYHVS